MRGTKIWLSQELQDDLERFARSRTLAARLVQRAQIVLMAAARKSDQEIAQAVGVVRQTVGLWRSRFVEQGIAGIEKDAPRSGRPRTITPARIDEIVRLTTQSTPVAATHWSNRTLAPVTEVSPSTIGRIWRAHGLKPHLVKSFKLSNDPRFAEKLEDVVPLYLRPPAGAVVISVDEKCQIQALDRTQPGLPWKKGRCGTMTHDYKRHGTTTLFAVNVRSTPLPTPFARPHSGSMTRSTVARKLGARDEDWRARIAAQRQSGVSVKQFCTQQGFTEQSFYYWQKRLQTPASMRFALVEPRRGATEPTALELVLTTGERLRIGAGVDARTLQQVLEALRA